MIKLFFSLILALILFFGGGCSSVSQAGYYWGNYSYTYLGTIREPSSKSDEAHMETLRKIIDESETRNLRVPPGVYAELANLIDKQGKSSVALGYYKKEMKLYPESRIFIERLLGGKNSE